MDSGVRRYVIIGNGFAGTTAAEQLRKNDAACTIDLFGDEPYTLYNRISLPPMLRKQIPEAKVMIRDQAWHEKNRIDLHLRSRVERIDTQARVVECEGRSYPYDALLVATGGRPNPTGKPGADDASNLFPFQYLDDTRAISDQIERSTVGVAIGGSFIAYELAEAFASRGLETHWLMRGPRGLHRVIDEIAGELLHDAAIADGVHMHYGEEVDSFVRSNGEITKVITTGGKEIAAECYAYGFGLTMNTELCEQAGIEVDRNGITCDQHLETSAPGVFAAGDVANFYDPILETRYRMGTWNNAGAQGKLVAVNMAGGKEAYSDVPEYSSLLFKGQTITQFGMGPELRGDLEMVRLIDRDKRWYRALFFLEQRLVGGLMLGKGNRAGKRKYVDAIKAKQAFERAEWEALLEWTA
jgi:3-phenylpropionate/trans-cinnamate dioxygenase ferredoxin reductase subunit